jgi:hypothetical protein
LKELRTEIEIGAPAERVWQILTDFASYPEWNPFVRSINGEVKEGAQLEVYLQPSGARGMTFRPTVLKAEPSRQFSWLGHLFISGLFDGEHAFEIEQLEDRVRFVQRESFRGLLAPLLLRMLENDTRRGFEEMNAALKSRAEAAAQAT